MKPPRQPSIAPSRHFLAVAVFVAVLVAVFYRAIFFGDVLASVDMLSKELPWSGVLPHDTRISNSTTADVLAIFYPWKHFVHDELRAGRFPLWCKYVGCGYPLAGEGMTKLYGLTTLFLWLASPPVASWLTFSTQLLIGMTGVYALLCALNVRWLAAVFGGLVFGLNSVMFQFLEFEHIVGGLMFLPWMCWALWHSADPDRGGGRFAALAGLFFGLTVMNSSVQGTAMVGVSSACCTASAMWQQQRVRWVRRSASTIILFTVLGFAVGAVALLPNLELIAQNARDRFGHVGWLELLWKRPLVVPAWLVANLNADALGNPQTFDILRGMGRIGTPATSPTTGDLRVYCGLAAFTLAVLGLRCKGEVRTLGLTLVLAPLVAVVVSPLFLILYFRYLAAGACGVAVLAALGLERILDGDAQLKPDLRRAVCALLALLAMGLAVGTVVTVERGKLLNKVEELGRTGTSFYKADQAWQHQKAQETVKNFSLGGNAVRRFAALAACVALLLAMASRRAWVAAALLVVLNTGDLVEVGWRTFPCASRSLDYPPTPALEFLRQQPGEFRVASRWDLMRESPTARANMLMMYGLDDPRVYESLMPANPLLDAQDWNALGVRFMVVPRDSTQSPGASWRLVFRDEVDVYENLNVQPRVSFTFGTNVGINEPAEIQVDKYVSGEILTRVTTTRAGRLIVRERMDPGWRAVVDGKPAQIATVDGLWQAIDLPPGNHSVSLRFQPATVRWGAVVSVLGLCAVLIVARRKNT